MNPTNIQMNYGLSQTDNLYGKGTIFYGDSFTFSSTLGRYSTILASYLYGPHTNHGANGQRAKACADFAMNMALGRTQTMILMIGLNDLLAVGINAKNGIVNNIKSMVAASLLNTNIPASAMSQVGTWFDGNTVMGDRARNIGGTPKATTGDFTHYRETTFDGDSVVVGVNTTYASSGPYRDLDVLVDGVMQDYIVNHTQTADQYGYNCKVYQGFGAGTHTLRVQPRVTNPAPSGGAMMIDYVGTLKDPADCAPVVIGHIPYVHPSQGLSNATVDAANDAIDAMVAAEFAGFPVVVARTNDYYTATSECLPDLIHPTHILTSPTGPGMQHIAEAFLEHFTY
jgi:hypothetical protein